MDLIWLIPLLPGIGAVINGLVGIRYFTKRIAGIVASTVMFGAFVLSANAFLQLLGTTDRYHKVTVASWIPAIPLETVDGIGSFEVPWAFVLDPLSAMMLLIVTGIGFLIHIYSIGYIDHEPRGGVARFFCYLNLFCFFMLMLVLGSNFLVMFVGWEGVGLCSYLLIGYWYRKESASDAGKKAFITNRVGDWGFVMGIFLIYFTFGTLDFRGVAEAVSTMPVETAAVGFGVLSFTLHWCYREECPDPTLCVVTGCHGRPDSGFCTYSCGHDGHCRCVYGLSQRRAVYACADDHGSRCCGGCIDGIDGGDDRTRPD